MKMEETECSETSAYIFPEAGELPKRKHTTYRTRRKLEIKITGPCSVPPKLNYMNVSVRAVIPRSCKRCVMGAVLLFVKKNCARDYHVNSHALLMFRVTPHFCVPRRAVGIHRLSFSAYFCRKIWLICWKCIPFCTKSVCNKSRETTLWGIRTPSSFYWCRTNLNPICHTRGLCLLVLLNSPACNRTRPVEDSSITQTMQLKLRCDASVTKNDHPASVITHKASRIHGCGFFFFFLNKRRAQWHELHTVHSLNQCLQSYPARDLVRAGVHAPTKSLSVPAPISLLPPVQPRSGVHTHADKIPIACKAVNLVSDAVQSTWLTCGIGGFICCVASSPETTTSKAERILGASYSSRKDTWRRLLYSLWETPRRWEEIL